MSKKALYVIYGYVSAHMRACAAVVPSTARSINQHPKYFKRSGMVPDTTKVIILFDEDNEVQAALAEEIKAAYVEAYDENVIVDVDLDELIKAAATAAPVKVETVTSKPLGRSLTEVKGIGPTTADILIAAGVTTLEELAALDDTLEEVAKAAEIDNLADLVEKASELVAPSE